MDLGIVLAIVLVVTMLLGMPVGMCLAISALAGMLLVDLNYLQMMPEKFLSGLDSFPLLAIPLFVLAGQLMTHGGLARRIVDMALVFVGRVHGGLGLVVIFSTMLMSGISGSPAANTAAIGSVAMPGMLRGKYPAGFATAILAAAGGVSTLVPPAIDLIIIGVIAGMSIGGLFAAGILPAIVAGLAIMLLAFLFSRKMGLPLADPQTWEAKRRILLDGFLPILMVVIILGGIYGGIFTPTEAAAVAVVYGFVVAFFVYRELTLKDMPEVLLKTASLSGVVLLVLATASIFSYALTIEGIPRILGDLIQEYAVNWVVFILFVHVVFLVLGMVMDCLPPILILMPILVPVAESFGFHPIHFGIIVAANVGLGMVSPPVGICLFVACGVSETPIEKVVRPILPFLAILVVALMVITFVPEITLFLPRMLGFI